MTRRKLPEITVREGVIEDLPELMEVADTFFAQRGTDSEYYDRDIFLDSALAYLSGAKGTKIYMAMHDGVVVGYYALCFNSIYSARPILYESHFAVHPDYVLSHAGRKLTKAAIGFGDEVRAICFYAGATSGIKRFDNSLINMYAKSGFINSGVMMRYEYG